MTIVIYKCEHIPCNRSCNQFVLDNILRQVHGIPITLNAITLNSFKKRLTYYSTQTQYKTST